MARLKKSSVILLALLLAACATTPPPPPTPPPASWLQQMEQQAIDSGVNPQVAHDALDNFIPNPRVIELDHKQPEVTITFAAYRQNNVTQTRAEKGAQLMRDYAPQLAAVEARTGVQPQYVVALWGMESSFGRITGNFETVNSLATLAYEGRRADLFRSELIAALRILERTHKSASELRGSWAGAMGQCQFMPSTYLKYAVSENGLGDADIWSNTGDALASIGNYLAAIGWQRDMPSSKPVDTDSMGQGNLVQPDGADGPNYIVFENFQVLKRWNRSTYFALAVGDLADEIRMNSNN